MNAITLKFSFKQLQAFNTGWELLDTLIAKTPQEKAMLSCVQDIKIKLRKKEISMEYSYTPSSTYRISLKVHEAFFLEMYWRATYKQLPLGFERNVILTHADWLNQKLA